MAETPDIRAVVQSAEEAVADGDHARAERLLLEAARLQEANLGPLHPDLANTLNNLGVLYENTSRLTQAEDCYRRAYAIVRTVLDPEHPFVETSGKNLRDFCEARGKPVEVPARAAARAAEPAAPRSAAAPPRWDVGDVPLEPRDVPFERLTLAEDPPPTRPRSRGVAIGIAAVCALVAITIVVTRPWSDSGVGAGFSPDETAPRPSATPPAPPVPAPAPGPATTPVPAPPAPSRASDDPAPSINPPAAVAERPVAAAAAGALPSVVDARVCRSLSTSAARPWQCAPVTGPEPGPFVFYTRVRAARDTTLQHRWYHGDRLHQAVDLRIRANPGSGYRTYSRTTVNSAGSGEWRVELRAEDGTLLDEERFTVR